MFSTWGGFFFFLEEVPRLSFLSFFWRVWGGGHGRASSLSASDSATITRKGHDFVEQNGAGHETS